jgi:hypothetical protein
VDTPPIPQTQLSIITLYEENRITGDEIRNLVEGQEITIFEYDRIYWIVHYKNGRLKDISRVRGGK